MATRWSILTREPGAPGPAAAATRALWNVVWGTDRRRTFFAVLATFAFVAGSLVGLHWPPGKVLSVAVTAAVFVSILTRPQLGVLALVLFVLLARSFEFETLAYRLGLSMVKVIGLFTLAGFIGIVVIKKARPALGHSLQLFFLYGLFGSMLLSSFAALLWSRVWIALFQIIQGLVLYTIFVNVFAREDWLIRYAWTLVLSICVAAFSGVLAVGFSGATRAAGSLGNPNGLAIVANQGIAAFLVLLLLTRGVSARAFFVAGLTFCAAAVVFTGSRGGLLTAAVIFGYELVKRRRGFLPYFVGLTVLVLVFSLIPERYKERQQEWFSTIFSGEVHRATAGSRGFIYGAALDMFARSPIIGIGPRTFGIIYQTEYAHKAKGPAARAQVVHSGVLEILVELGIVGMIFFIGLVAATFYVFRKNAKLCRLAGMPRLAVLNELFEVSFLAAVVGGAFESIIRSNLFYAFLATAAVVNVVVRRRVAEITGVFYTRPAGSAFR